MSAAGAIAAAKAIDAAVTALQAVIAITNAAKPVSDAIAARIAEGRTEWTQAERDAIDAHVKADKDYARDQIEQAGGTVAAAG